MRALVHRDVCMFVFVWGQVCVEQRSASEATFFVFLRLGLLVGARAPQSGLAWLSRQSQGLFVSAFPALEIIDTCCTQLLEVLGTELGSLRLHSKYFAIFSDPPFMSSEDDGWAGELVKVLSNKLDEGGSFSGNHTVEGERWLLQIVLGPLYQQCGTCNAPSYKNTTKWITVVCRRWYRVLLCRLG